MKLSSLEIAKVFGAKRVKHASDIRYVSIDSRQIVQAKQTLFFALKGTQVDGHQFIAALYKRGVRNFVVTKKQNAKEYPKANFYIVKNAKVALQKLATYYRNTLNAIVIGITGSNGKTIIKEWLATLLGELGKTAKSPKSFNSQIGVPLSIFQIEKKDRFAVLEAGISKTGEMLKLQKLILPDMGVFTNIGSAHDEGFEERAQKTKEKLKLFKSVQTLIYCSDQTWAKQARLPKADMHPWSTKKGGFLEQVVFESKNDQTEILFNCGGVKSRFTVGFTDAASLENVMHCITVCLSINMSAQQIQSGLDKLYAVDMRLQMLAGENQCTLINDAYTADIESLKAGLEFQARQGLTKTKTIIISDFLQTGKGSKKLYAQIAALLHQYKIQKVIGIGQEVVFLDKYLGPNTSRNFYTHTEAFLNHLQMDQYINEVILVKGARRFKFEQIIMRMTARRHDAALQVDLGAMLHNVKYFRQKIGNKTKLLAMIKAAGYGSGSVQVAHLLEKSKVDYFGVAYADEGVALRKKGIQKPIMVLNCPSSSFEDLSAYDLEPEIYSLSQLEQLTLYLQSKKSMAVHIKIDTGMNRLGFVKKDWKSLAKMLIDSKKCIRVKSIFTHLAASDMPSEDVFSKDQINQFNKAYAYLSKEIKRTPEKHALNTSGILRFPQYRYDMVRLGLGLYGIDPTHTESKQLEEVLTLKARISQIKQLSPGETVGYSRKGKVKTAKTIAIVNIGYADGLLRKAGNGRFKVLINGKLAPTVGNICMDMCMIDISKLVDVKVNDEVIIFGKDHSVGNLCKALNTIPYEVYTSISERIKRVYYQE